ncbi:hypothetical protein JW916_01160 [Candidatus Sumerlaeota bacterium]|nr:hypothetical protein [Candidatus Sumerlaeota bacterium]
MDGCLACDLMEGRISLPGGRAHETSRWVVEHCVGPLGLGTLIVKPKRHCVHVWELTLEESAELGPLLTAVADAVRSLLHPDQVYVCLWSRQGWTPGHIHFVLQPVGPEARSISPRPGPRLQAAMSDRGMKPSPDEVEALCARLRRVFEHSTKTVASGDTAPIR